MKPTNLKRALWYLHIDDAEFGPLTSAELQAILRSGQIRGRIFAWRPGMTSWIPCPEHSGTEDASLSIERAAAEFEAERPSITGSRKEVYSREERMIPRARLAAVVFYMGPTGRRQFLGVCDDISQSGIRCITFQSIEVEIGGGATLEVFPAYASGLEAFRVDATAVRGRRRMVALRFRALPGRLASRIDEYVSRWHTRTIDAHREDRSIKISHSFGRTA